MEILAMLLRVVPSLRVRALVVIVVAIVMAFVSARILFNGSAMNTVPWGILALATSLLASSKRESWILGGIFGFTVSYAFLWFDNTDTKTLARVLVLLLVIVLPALFGAICGFLLAWLGWSVERPLRTQRESK